MQSVWKLLVLLAVLVMPFGMTAAPAAAPDHETAATMAMQHCPDPAPSHGSKPGFVECTMACSAALPASDFGSRGPLRILGAPNLPDVAQRLDGLHPDTATPPPKRS